MTTTQRPRRLTIILPKRYCAAKGCANILPPESPRHHTTCCWRCKVAVDAELAAIEAADKLPYKEPF